MFVRTIMNQPLDFYHSENILGRHTFLNVFKNFVNLTYLLFLLNYNYVDEEQQSLKEIKNIFTIFVKRRKTRFLSFTKKVIHDEDINNDTSRRKLNLEDFSSFDIRRVLPTTKFLPFKF